MIFSRFTIGLAPKEKRRFMRKKLVLAKKKRKMLIKKFASLCEGNISSTSTVTKGMNK